MGRDIHVLLIFCISGVQVLFVVVSFTNTTNLRWGNTLLGVWFKQSPILVFEQGRHVHAYNIKGRIASMY